MLQAVLVQQERLLTALVAQVVDLRFAERQAQAQEREQRCLSDRQQETWENQGEPVTCQDFWHQKDSRMHLIG